MPRTHGHTTNGRMSGAYRSWKAMMARCYNKNASNYKHYGGRGIKVCERWRTFENFLADMGERPDGLTLGRKNNDGDYCLANCEWESQSSQVLNSRNNRQITIGDETRPASVWARHFGVSPALALGRISRGWAPERAVSELPKPAGCSLDDWLGKMIGDREVVAVVRTGKQQGRKLRVRCPAGHEATGSPREVAKPCRACHRISDAPIKIGDRFGDRSVVGRVLRPNGRYAWEVECAQGHKALLSGRGGMEKLCGRCVSGRIWDEDEKKILREHRSASATDLAALLPGRTPTAIKSYRNRHAGLVTGHGWPWEEWELAIVRSLGADLTTSELAERLPARRSGAIAAKRSELGVVMSDVTDLRNAHPGSDLTGRRFGRLVVVALASRGPTKWLCKCDCGREHTTRSSNLLRGGSESCGCLRSELASARLSAQAKTHGLSRTPEYSAWRSMMSRCYNPKDAAYPRYGGRGIKVCKRWHKLENFLADMDERPPGLSLDRLDNDGNYEPTNCEWRTDEEQQNNRRDNNYVTWNGETLTEEQWIRRTGLPVRERLRAGWPVEAALTVPKLVPAVDAIACPRCGVPAGEPCVSLRSGKLTKRPHKIRTRSYRAQRRKSGGR